MNSLSQKAKAFYSKLKIYADENGIVAGRSYASLGITWNSSRTIIKELLDKKLIEVQISQGVKRATVFKIMEFCD